jgi:tetratricopeptide (TPR) repeat protein
MGIRKAKLRPGALQNRGCRVCMHQGVNQFMNAGKISVICALLAVGSASAQTLVALPEDSQLSTVSQRVGLTDITVRYHRPLVKGRKVWGGLVPYDQVWRAGANDNTTIEFSTPVTVEGQPLAKGIYGLHMLPGTDSWGVIFSKNSSSWGSFSYDKAEDALRVTIKPQPSEMHEALTYDFDDVKPDSTAVTMRWEKLAAPIHVSADVNAVTLASLAEELRSGKQYTWQGFAEAAQFTAQHNVALDQGLIWANKSIASEERMENVMLKAQLLKMMKRDAEAKAARDHAMQIGNVTQIYFYGRQLQAEGKPDEAMDIFRLTVKRFPDSWIAHMATARLNSAAGDYAGALKEVKLVQSMDIPEAQKPNLVNLAKRLENKEDINK